MERQNRKRNGKVSRGNRQFSVTGDAQIIGPDYGQRNPTIRLDKFLITPPQLIVKLRYKVKQQLVNVGGALASHSYNLNGVYDVDPSVGSTATPGFAEWMTLYGSYQVINTKVDLTICNLEGASDGAGIKQPLQVYWLASRTVIASNSLGSGTNDPSNRFGGVSMISAVGGQDRFRVTRTINMAALYGNAMNYWGTVNNFQGTSVSNPSTEMQFAIGIETTLAVMAVGAFVDGFLDFEVLLNTPLKFQS